MAKDGSTCDPRKAVAIGELNGRWATLLKLQLLAFPVVAALIGYGFVQLIELREFRATVLASMVTHAQADATHSAMNERTSQLSQALNGLAILVNERTTNSN